MPLQIQLLQVTHEHASERILGLFTHALLDDLPSSTYTPISYSWGSSEHVDRVWFGGDHFIEITQSASEVLPAMIKAGEAGFTWIDALCINQNDLEEKNQQVPSMRYVYSFAKHVTAWLGEASADSNLAMSFCGFPSNGR